MSTMTLFPFQEEGAKWLSRRHRALLLDAPGLGKTIQAITAANLCGMEAFDAVAPASVRTQWVSTMANESHAKKQRAHSYNAARDKGLPLKMGALALDEAHYLKGATSGRTHAIYGTMVYGEDGFIADADRVWCMTGTPMPKDARDLYPMMRAVVPASLHVRHRGIMDYWSFVKRYCLYYEGDYGIVVKGHKNVEELRERLAPYMLRRTKKQVRKDWKKPLISDIQFDVGSGLKTLLKMEADSEGALVGKTLQRHGIEGLDRITDQSATLRRYTGMLLIGPVVEWTLDKFDNGEDKLVIVAYHREVIQGIHDGLKKHKIRTVIYRGGMSESDKDQAKKEFIYEKDVKAIVLQINAGGTGLDGLQKVSSRMLLAEYSWVPSDNQQAMDRIDRIGQQSPVLIEFAGIAGSLHGKITAAFRRRANENDELFGE